LPGVASIAARAAVVHIARQIETADVRAKILGAADRANALTAGAGLPKAARVAAAAAVAAIARKVQAAAAGTIVALHEIIANALALLAGLTERALSPAFSTVERIAVERRAFAVALLRRCFRTLTAFAAASLVRAARLAARPAVFVVVGRDRHAAAQLTVVHQPVAIVVQPIAAHLLVSQR
jgi:hypothetical protein